MNNNIKTENTQDILRGDGSVDYQKLDYLSLAAVATLGQAVFELAENPIETLSRLHGLISRLYEHEREQDVIITLGVIYGMLGVKYAGQITQLESHEEARNQFIYGFIANMGEFIEELA